MFIDSNFPDMFGLKIVVSLSFGEAGRRYDE